jgi:archaellum component FlaC
MKLLVVVLLFGVVVFAASAGGAGSNATDVEELRQQLDKIKGEVAQLSRDLQSLRNELNRLRELLDRNWTEVQRVKDRVAGLENANRTLGSIIDQLQRRIDDLDSQLSGLNSSLMVVRGQLGRNWTEVQTLRGNVSSVQRELSDGLDAVRGKLNVLRGEVDLLRGWLAGNVTMLGRKADFSELERVGGELGVLRLVAAGLGAVAAAALVLAVLAWRRAGRVSAGGVEVCG